MYNIVTLVLNNTTKLRPAFNIDAKVVVINQPSPVSVYHWMDIALIFSNQTIQFAFFVQQVNIVETATKKFFVAN